MKVIRTKPENSRPSKELADVYDLVNNSTKKQITEARLKLGYLWGCKTCYRCNLAERDFCSYCGTSQP